MPAYFSIQFTCDKKSLYPGLVRDFCDRLIENGCRFLGGYWGYEEDSLADIAAWNQRRLEENLEPGVREAYLYKQLLLAYEEFSEVRMYLTNFRGEETFTFHVILPEDELIAWGKEGPGYDMAKIKGLMSLCERLWQQPYICLIQTELELSDPVPSEAEIREGAVPGAEPFAILSKAVWQAWKEKGGQAEKYRWENIAGEGVMVCLK